MRRTTKTILVILLVSLLALLSVGASPNAWAWLGQVGSSATSEVQQEALTVPSSTQNKDSTSSANTSGDVVVMSKSDLAAAVALIEAGEEDAKKSKMTVEEVEKMALATNTATSAYNRLMKTKFVVKGLLDGTWKVDMTSVLDWVLSSRTPSSWRSRLQKQMASRIGRIQAITLSGQESVSSSDP